MSKKLRGRICILLSDLECLARKFDLPFTWFFEGYGRKDMPSDKDVWSRTRALSRARRTPS